MNTLAALHYRTVEAQHDASERYAEDFCNENHVELYSIATTLGQLPKKVKQSNEFHSEILHTVVSLMFDDETDMEIATDYIVESMRV